MTIKVRVRVTSGGVGPDLLCSAVMFYFLTWMVVPCVSFIIIKLCMLVDLFFFFFWIYVTSQNKREEIHF